MKSQTFDSREAWLNGRLGKVTGSAVKETVNLKDGGTKSGVYRTAAESLIGSAAIAEADMSSTQAMQRGHDLEPEAIKRFEAATGKKVKRELVLWERDDDSRMAVSPDGTIGKTAAIEVKCLLSPKHAEAAFNYAKFLTEGGAQIDVIPKNTGGYEEQLAQYFVVNEKLTKVFYGFYHPDFPAPFDFFYLTFTRRELEEDINRILEAEREAVAKVRAVINALTLYSPEEVKKEEAVRKELLSDNRSALNRVHAGIAERVNETTI